MMKHFILIYFTVVTVLFTSAFGAFHDRKLLVSQFGGKTKSLTDIEHVRLAIREQTIHNLYVLPETVKIELVNHAETAMKGHYPVKTALEYMEFFRDGNRAHYQEKLTAHRGRIAHLVIGNLLEREHNKTSLKYVDEIVDGVWMILEESTWCWPAHLNLQSTADHLANPAHLAIDLGAGEVAKFLGWVKLLMAEKFDKISTVINKRIDFELRKRIFQGYLDNNYGWSGFGGPWQPGANAVNNWNVWVNGNILKSALFTLNDIALFDKVLNRTLYSVDNFLDIYGEDGGCDEGPAYWRQAGGRLIEYLESLEQIYGASAGEYIAKANLIKLIGEYSYKMRITANWFVNFADAIPILTYPPSLIAKYGLLFGDENMKQFAAYMLQFVQSNGHSYFATLLNEDLNEFCNYVNVHKQIESFKASAPELDLVWLPDIQVVNVRSKREATASNRLFLSAKAGNNDESHNHNDVGNFVLFQDGNPVVIDIGVGTYTAQTFNSHRYELFYMQSQYHNCPTINGIDQQAGAQFASHNTTFQQLTNQDGSVHFQSDIAAAYPITNAAKHWIRSFHFDRTTNVIQVEDAFELNKYIAPQQLHFIIHEGITVVKTENGAHLQQANKVNVQMEFDWKVFDMKVEVKSLEGDHHLTQVWGENVKRITLTTNANYKQLSGHFTVRFTVGK